MRWLLRQGSFRSLLTLTLVALFTSLIFSVTLVSAAISSYQATNDSTNVFYQLNYSGSYSFYRIYIDSDQNSGTGFATAGIGANYLVENNSLYRHNGGGWSWTFIKTVTYTNSAGSARWTINRADIGETANPNSSYLVFQVEAPLETSARYTHTYSALCITRYFSHAGY